jgi:hypothetical protein
VCGSPYKPDRRLARSRDSCADNLDRENTSAEPSIPVSNAQSLYPSYPHRGRNMQATKSAIPRAR